MDAGQLGTTPGKLVDYLICSGYYQKVLDRLPDSKTHRNTVESLVFLNNIVNVARQEGIDFKKETKDICPKQCVLSRIFTAELAWCLLQNQRFTDAIIDSMVPNVPSR